MSGPGRAERSRAVERAIARFAAFSAEERLRLYRLHLQAAVTRASPLAIDLAAQGGRTIEQVACLLPVPHDWPPGVAPVGRVARKGGILRGRILPGGRQPSVSLETSTQLRGGGVAVRGSDDPRGDLGFKPEGDCLEAVSMVGGTSLRTFRGDGLIATPVALPETALLAMKGRAVDAVVSHPALNGRGYLITGAYLDDFGEGSVLRFGTGLAGIELPWADELAREVARLDAAADAWLARHLPQDVVASRYAGGGRARRSDP